MQIRRRQLGDLPPAHSKPRNEYEVPPALNTPPMGNETAYSPTALDDGGGTPVTENQSAWSSIAFTVSDIEPVKLQDFMFRKFLLVQNNSGFGTLFLGFGWIPTKTNALVLTPGAGYEPFRYPINDIWALASHPNVEGILIFGT